MPKCGQNLCKLYADDTQVLAKLKSCKSLDLLQENIDNLVSWSDKWSMLFNSKKCKVNENVLNENRIELNMFDPNLQTNHILEFASNERDLELILSSNCKWAEQAAKAANRANGLLGLLNKTFVNKDEKTFSTLHQRLHASFGVGCSCLESLL
jgi:hypothetical protein